MEATNPIITFDRPYGSLELAQSLDALCGRYSFLRRETIGRSVLGNELHAIRIGHGSAHIFINGAFHANEWITTPVVLRWIEEAASAVAGGGSSGGILLRELFDRISVWAVPMVNPDGVDLVLNRLPLDHPYAENVLDWNRGSEDFSQWKANIRGVDLNDQFPANWEIERDRRAVEGPAPRDYTGELPLSEPEAQAVASLTEKIGFDMVFAFHTQGEEIYWNYRGEEPPASAAFARKMEEASGYKAVELFGSDAGFKDWFIHRWQRPGFTVELGLGVNPLPLDQLPAMVRAASNILRTAVVELAESN